MIYTSYAVLFKKSIPGVESWFGKIRWIPSGHRRTRSKSTLQIILDLCIPEKVQSISQNSFPNFICIIPKSFMVFCQELRNPKKNYENKMTRKYGFQKDQAPNRIRSRNNGSNQLRTRSIGILRIRPGFPDLSESRFRIVLNLDKSPGCVYCE
jgi:hypothetical protein